MPPHYEPQTPAALARSTVLSVLSGWGFLLIADRGVWWWDIGTMVVIVTVQSWVLYHSVRRVEVWSSQRQGRFASRRASTVAAIVQAVSFLISGFAATYWLVSQVDCNAFSEKLSKVGAAYFSVATFTTTGFGDIHAKSDPARAIVTLQMLLAVATVSVVLGTAVARSTSTSADEPAGDGD